MAEKKLFTLFLALAASVGITYAWDYEHVQIGNLYYNLDASNQIAEVTRGNYSNLTEADISSSVTYNAVTYSVTSIGNSAFSYCTGLMSVTIPNSITSIGYSAFQFTVLTSVTIPNSVTSIGYSAFFGCSNLTSVTIPNSVISIGKEAFSGVLNIVYNGSATGSPWGAKIKNGYVEGWLGYNDNTKTVLLACSGAAKGEIIIPNSVTSIGDHAFEDCQSLTSVVIPNSVTNIGEYAFRDCIGLTSVTIPNSVTSIGGGAFNGVLNIVYNGSATGSPWGAKIKNGYVEGWLGYNDNTKTVLLACSRAAKGEIIIPNSVTNIGDNAFMECKGMTSVNIPNSITSIGYGAFWGCISLTSVTIPNSVTTSIRGSAFAGCIRLKSVTIGNSVPSIGSYSFDGCISLTSVTIGNGVSNIGEYAFRDCKCLASVTIPNSVTNIGEGAFYKCSGLTSVSISNSVTSIGDGAFFNCSGLTSVSIGNRVTSIGDRAFGYCTALTSISIGSNVTSIGIEAFSGCTGLSTITCEAANPPTLGRDAFFVVNKSIPLYVLEGSIYAYKAVKGWKDFTNILPILAQKTEVTTPVVEPDVTSAVVAWPVVAGAAYYQLIVKDNNGNIICKIVLDAQGQLINITFNAPARESESQQTQSAGFAFTVTGLEPGTQYNYSIIAKNASGTITLNTETGTFTTKVLDALENTAVNGETSRKFLRNGQVLIERGDKTYTLQGQQLK